MGKTLRMDRSTMASVREPRKIEESELHDALRGDLRDDSRFTANKKWYCVTRKNRELVKQWLLNRCKGKRVLDYCCGDGETAIWLAQEGAEAIGIDISPRSIRNALEAAKGRGVADRVRFIMGDAESMNLEADYFDYIVATGILHHLDLMNAYAELSRVLKPEGAVICTEALKHNPMFQLYRRWTPHLRSAWEVEHILGRREIFLARKYFADVNIIGMFHLATILAVPFRRRSVFPRILKILEGVDSLLLRVPAIRWWAWMIVFVLARPKKSPSV